MNPENSAPTVELVIYKRIVEGDLSKFTASSNITQSGGGARDLRFSPADTFYSAFQQMFPARSQEGVLSGCFSWTKHGDTRVLIHPPTNSRPNEVRIGRVHECFPADAIPDSAADCVLLLVLDSTGRTYPYFTSRHSLANDCWHPAVKEPILAGLGARRSANMTAMGYIDIAHRRVYTNGRV